MKFGGTNIYKKINILENLFINETKTDQSNWRYNARFLGRW